MDAADAVKAAQFVNCDQIVGVHYDTFPPIKIDHERRVKFFRPPAKRCIS